MAMRIHGRGQWKMNGRGWGSEHNRPESMEEANDMTMRINGGSQ